MGYIKKRNACETMRLLEIAARGKGGTVEKRFPSKNCLII